MNDDMPPLKIDLRLILETIGDGLAVERSVLSAEAKPAVIQVAADASAALRAPPPTSNAPSVEHQP